MAYCSDLQTTYDSLSTRLRDPPCCNYDDKNKPDFREFDLGSPVSTLKTRSSFNNGVPTSSSSSSSSGSLCLKTNNTYFPQKLDNGARSNSADLSCLSDISPLATDVSRSTANSKPGHRRSISAGSPLIYSGTGYSSIGSHGNGATSPHPNLGAHLLPSGNICPSGKILKTGLGIKAQSRTDILGTGTGNYGHGSIMRSGSGGVAKLGNGRNVGGCDAEEVKRAGNELYKKGNFLEALALYDKAISLSPENAAYRSNRAAALTSLGRLGEAVRECEEAVTLDPSYGRAHQRLSSLYLRLGQAEDALFHLGFNGQEPDPVELHKFRSMEKHLSRCAEARKLGDWKMALRESDAAITIGADSAPQIIACKAEALLKLHQTGDAESIILNIPKLEYNSHTKFFSMVPEAYLLYVRAQMEMALGRFENAVSAAEKAVMIDYSNVEIIQLLQNVKTVAKSRARGNDLFTAGRYAEACSAYGEGINHDRSNSVLYCNRAVCWSKLGFWEKSIEDCNEALRIHQSNTKALLRRAASNEKVGRWEDAVRDYETLNKQLPRDNEVAESLQQAKIALMKKKLVENFSKMKVSSEVEQLSTMDKFTAAISSSGVSVVHFKVASNELCEDMSPFLNTLCIRYPSVRFFKVYVDESLAVAKAESIRRLPTFKIYKNGDKVKEMVCPTHQSLEHSVKSYCK